MNTELVITHTDLDGAASYCVVCWAHGARLPVKPLTTADFASFWKNSILKNIDKFKNIYICDICPEDSELLYDFPNVTIIDHHATTIERKHKFTRATVVAQEAPSTCYLAYKHFKLKLNDNKKLLLSLANDYDSYEHKSPKSKLLNYLFWSYQGDRVSKFYEEFQNGFTGFNSFQKNIIKFYLKRLAETLRSLKTYKGEVEQNNRKYSICSTFAEFAINDVADHVLSVDNSDIAIVVNVKSGKVSFRKRKGCGCDLNILAKKLADGGGHADASGGILSDTFINFSKALLPNEF
jgi:oligoribonuclease NrnB/cAMP/cGMP phosphodiesterase (DHH superfamily)